MSGDIASLGVDVNTQSADKGANSLDKLAASAARAEAAAQKLRKATADADAAEAKATTGKIRAAQAEETLAAARSRNASINEKSAARSLAADASLTASITRVQAAQMKLAAASTITAQQQTRAAAQAVAAQNQQTAAAARAATAQVRLQNLTASGASAAAKAAAQAVTVQNQQAASAVRLATAQARLQQIQQRNQVAANSNARRGQNGGFGNNNVANIAAQFQDIGVTAAMGMSPLQIALQQGTQLSAIFTGMRNPISAIGLAIRSILSPMSLFVIAAIAAGVALFQWYSHRKGIEDLDETLKRHSKTVENLKTLYGETAKEFADLITVPGGTGLSQSLVNIDQKKLAEASVRGQTYIGQALSGNSGYFGEDKDALKAGYGANKNGPQGLVDALKNPDFSMFRTAIQGLLSDTRSGTDGMDTFLKSVNAVLDSQKEVLPETVNLGYGLQQLAAESLDVSGKFSMFAVPINKFRLGVAEGNSNVEELISSIRLIGATTGFADLADEAASYFKALAPILQTLKAINDAQKAFTDRAASKFQSEYFTDSQISGLNESRARDRANANTNMNAGLQGMLARTDAERIAAAEAQARADNPVKGYDQDEEARIAQTKEQNRIEAEVTKTVQDRLTARRESVAQAGQELTVIGKTVEEATYLNEKFSMMAEIKKDAAEHGRIISEAEVADVEKTARNLAEIAALKAKMSLDDDLQFERSQMSRTGDEQDIASRLRGTGMGMDSAEADFMRETQRMQQLRDGVKGFFDDFEQGILSGDSIGKALATSVVNALTRSLDKMMENAVTTISNAIVNSVFGSSTSAGSASSSFGTVGGFADLIFGSSGSSSSSGSNSSASTVATGSMSAYREAIKAVESAGSGGYSALGPMLSNGNQALGAYQVMSKNLPSWSQEALGQSISKDQFLSSPSSQDAIFDHFFGKSMSKYGNPQDAASVWFTGSPRSAASGAAQDVLGTSGNQYVEKFNTALGSATTSLDGLNTVGGDAAKGLSSFANSLSTFPSAPLGGAGAGAGMGAPNLLNQLMGIGGSTGWGAAGDWLQANPGGYMGLWDSGGYTGHGSKNEPAGVVHRGEYVFSARATRAIGLGNLESAHSRARGYADGGAVDMMAPMKAQPATSSSGGIQLSFAPTVHVDSGGDGDAGDKVKKALDSYQKNFTTNVVKALKEAKIRGLTT